MNLSIVGRHIDLTDGIKAAIENAVESLKKYHLNIISLKATISEENKKNKKTFMLEFSINIAHKSIIIIKQKDKDIYVAIDAATDRASKKLRRLHDKDVEHKVIKPEEIEAQKILADEYDETHHSVEDEIVPVDLELHKPIDIEDAITILKDSDLQFFVFNDLDGKMRVIFKRRDGKFGLY
jgi:putative sigma-54 modulation protein